MTDTADHPTTSLSYFWWASKHPPADPKTSFVGKVVLITGANAGLGFEAATKFAALGVSKLIFGVRSLEKGKAAKAQIERVTKCRVDVIQLFKLDMSSYDSVENFVKEVTAKFPKINAAVLNAGVAPAAYNLSPHGYEMSIQVNVISTAYLGILLLPSLRETAAATQTPSHLEFVSSHGHTGAKVETIKGGDSILGKVNDPKLFSFMVQYVNSKLLEMWAMVQIAAKVSPSEVIVTASCPGLCRSSLGRDFSLALRVPDGLFKRIFGRSAEEGSRTLVSAVTVGEEAHGGFWTNDAVTTYVAYPTSFYSYMGLTVI
jgi:NAD(P)-dependent dehydrogenase (short-subunit alcohol dehydrogenase family)